MGASILQAFAAAGTTCLLNHYPDNQNLRDAEEIAQQLRQQQVPVHLLAADVSRFDAVETMMRQAQDLTGGLDILVNNAGILRDRSVKRMTVDNWSAVLHTNLDGVFFCSKLGAEVSSGRRPDRQRGSISGIVGFHGQATTIRPPRPG